MDVICRPITSQDLAMLQSVGGDRTDGLTGWLKQKAFAGLAAYASAGALATTEEVVELIDGFLVGALQTEGVTSVDTCVSDFGPAAVDMDKAVLDFEDGSYFAVADGIYRLGEFISEVGLIMEDCATLDPADVSTLAAMGSAFLRPKELIMNAERNLLLNGVTILRDITAGRKDLQAHEYYQAGLKFGELGALVLWGKQAMNGEGELNFAMPLDAAITQ